METDFQALGLDGIRILDLSRIWAGPLAGRILADLGAEVIRITSRATLPVSWVSPEVAEIMGIFPENDPGARPWDRTALMNDLGRNKMDLTLELDTPEGIHVFKRLVKVSDVVLENYSPRVMPNFGLDYPVLKAIHPGIIMCSMSGFGLSGPYRNYVSYGTHLDAASGLASLRGYPDRGPRMAGNPYPDPAAALHAVSAILAALFFKRRTGQGQHIDLSQCESATCLLGEAVLGFALTGRLPVRRGNRRPGRAPHGCYRCQGHDQWVVLSIRSEKEWAALKEAMAYPAWAEEERFSNRMKRLDNQDELDGLIEIWTMRHGHQEVMTRLQQAGVPAGAVQNGAELIHDPHLNDRGFFWEIDHPEVGPRRYCGLPIRFSGTPVKARSRAPGLGEHNEYVLGEILGLSENEIAELKEKGVIGDKPKGRP